MPYIAMSSPMLAHRKRSITSLAVRDPPGPGNPRRMTSQVTKVKTFQTRLTARAPRQKPLVNGRSPALKPAFAKPHQKRMETWEVASRSWGVIDLHPGSRDVSAVAVGVGEQAPA
jgi:hypothetical protein